jgi:hypothetical protein
MARAFRGNKGEVKGQTLGRGEDDYERNVKKIFTLLDILMGS